VTEPLAKKLLLVGWDAADWQLMHPQIDSGRMPHLKRLVERSTTGHLQTLQPLLSPILWTTMATDKRAYLHGVHGFVEPRPDGTALRPTSSRTRQCKALWNMLARSGKRCQALNWYAIRQDATISGATLLDITPRCSCCSACRSAATWKARCSSMPSSSRRRSSASTPGRMCPTRSTTPACATVSGSGHVDLGTETLDLAFVPRTKVTSVVAMSSPIYLRGPFADPAVSVDAGAIVTRGLGALARGCRTRCWRWCRCTTPGLASPTPVRICCAPLIRKPDASSAGRTVLYK